MKYGLGEYALIFKALGDETRLKILTMLRNGRTCACRILEAFQFTQPTLSYHMKQLTDSGLVTAEKDGKWVYYSISSERVEQLHGFIAEVKRIENVAGCCSAEDDCDE